jgi:16S rRNA (guanine527-N7)-methyltransferase
MITLDQHFATSLSTTLAGGTTAFPLVMFHVKHHGTTNQLTPIVSRETMGKDMMTNITQLLEPVLGWSKRTLSNKQWELLEQFHQILLDGSQRMSLISKADIPNIWGRHFADAMTAGALLDLSKNGRWLDMGCGAGLPLVPLAILLPDWDVVGMDTRTLRIDFLQQVCKELQLMNMQLIRGNARTLGNLPEHRASFDWVSTRAVGKIPQDAAMALPFLKQGGSFLTFKGSEHVERIDGYHAPTYTPYRLPSVDNDLHLVRAIKL